MTEEMLRTRIMWYGIRTHEADTLLAENLSKDSTIADLRLSGKNCDQMLGDRELQYMDLDRRFRVRGWASKALVVVAFVLGVLVAK